MKLNAKSKKPISVQEIAKKNNIFNLQTYGKSKKWVKAKLVKPKKELTPEELKKKDIRKLNARLRKLTNEFDESEVEQYYKRNIMKNLQNIENLEFTEKGYISTKVEDDLAIQAAENLLKTVSGFYKEAAEEYKQEMGKELPYKENKEELRKFMADKLLEEDDLNDIYEATLTRFYNAKPGDINASKMQVYNEILSDIKGKNRIDDHETRVHELRAFVANIDKLDENMSPNEFLTTYIRGGL